MKEQRYRTQATHANTLHANTLPMFRLCSLSILLPLLLVLNVRIDAFLVVPSTRPSHRPVALAAKTSKTAVLKEKVLLSIKNASRLPWRKKQTSETVEEHDDEAALQVIQKHFPGALSSHDVLQKVASTIESRGFTSTNTLYAQSVCPDEINHRPHDSLPNLLSEHLGEVFHLGGLAGIPFTGRTGFAAFSQHVPDDDGNLFILLAPHIGLSSSLQLGKYCREGQGTKEGAACGAAVGALQHCCSDQSIPDMISNGNEDHQMAYIIHQIHHVKDEIMQKATENEQQAALALHTHAIGKTMLDSIVNMNFGGPNSKLLILSGIQINMPSSSHEDYFLPLSFDLHTKTANNETEDLTSETFGV